MSLNASWPNTQLRPSGAIFKRLLTGTQNSVTYELRDILTRQAIAAFNNRLPAARY